MNKRLTQEMIAKKTKCDSIQQLKQINFCTNDLEDISILDEMPELEIISLSLNKIRTLKHFANMPNLQELYLRRNMIGDPNELKYLSRCYNLKTLSLIDNPISETRGYRINVLRCVPGLMKLDDISVTEQEKAAISQALQSYQMQHQAQEYPPMKKPVQAYDNYPGYPNSNEGRFNMENPLQQHHRRHETPQNGRKQIQNQLEYNKGFYDDQDISRGNRKLQPDDHYGINYAYDKRKQQPPLQDPKSMYQQQQFLPQQHLQENKINNRHHNRVSNVTNCLLMLLTELNTNELEYVKGEIDKRMNKG